MQALFYASGATVIAIIAIAAYKLAHSTNKRDPLLWGIFVVLTAVTVWSRAELAEFFIFAGLAVLLLRAWPGWKSGLFMAAGAAVLSLAIWQLEAWLGRAGTASDSADVRWRRFFCFLPRQGPLYSAAVSQSFRFCNKAWSSNSAGSMSTSSWTPSRLR
jgi:hypothetical protein